jgi:hypothetical protein
MKSLHALAITLLSAGILSSMFAEQASHTVQLPFEMTMSGLYGASVSYIEADGLFDSYFAPTSKIEHVIGRPFGVEIGVQFKKYFGVSVGLRTQKLGQNTGEQKVMFADDIFTHDFRTTAEMRYIAGTAIFKAGYSAPSYWAFLRIGGMGQLNMSSKLDWKIDGRSATPGSQRMPAVEVRPTTSSYVAGFESGYRYCNHGIFLLADCIYGRRSMADGLSGKAYHRALEVFLGYRFFFNDQLKRIAG